MEKLDLEVLVKSENGGVKDDSEKAMYHFLNEDFEEEMALRMTHGAKKYSEWNFLGLDKDRIYSSLRRHIKLYRTGEWLDDDMPDTSHLAAVAVNAMMLYWIELNEREK